MIRLRKVARRKKGSPNMFHVVVADCVRKNWQQVVDPQPRRLHLNRIVKLRKHASCMNMSPSVAETVCIVTAHLESLGRGVLQDRDGIVATLKQEFDRFRTKLRGVESIKHDRPSSSLSVSDFPGENRFTSGLAAPVKLEIAISDHLDQLVAQCFG